MKDISHGKVYAITPLSINHIAKCIVGLWVVEVMSFYVFLTLLLSIEWAFHRVQILSFPKYRIILKKKKKLQKQSSSHSIHLVWPDVLIYLTLNQIALWESHPMSQNNLVANIRYSNSIFSTQLSQKLLG